MNTERKIKSNQHTPTLPPILEKMVCQTNEFLIYQEKRYIKIYQLKSRVEMITGLSKKRANLWLAIEEGCKFPAAPEVVPEYL